MKYLSIFVISLFCLQANADYYNGTQGLTGQALKSKLHQIIDGQKPLKYTQSGNADWFDGKKVDSIKQLRQQIAEAKDGSRKTILMRVKTQNGIRFVALPLKKS